MALQSNSSKGFVGRPDVASRYIDSLPEGVPLTMEYVELIAKTRDENLIQVVEKRCERPDTIPGFDEDDSDLFMPECGKDVPSLTLKEEKELLKVYRNGEDSSDLSLKTEGEMARQKLIEAYSPLVMSLAKKMSNEKIGSADLYQEGLVVLMDVLKKIDLGRLLFPYTVKYIYKKMNQSAPSDSQAEVSLDELENEMSLSEESSDDFEALTLLDILGYVPAFPSVNYINELSNPYEISEFSDLRRQINSILVAALTPHQNDILRRRFGLIDLNDSEKIYDDEKTLKEISDDFGVTRERIRCIEAGALRELRYSSVSSKRLKALVDGDAFPDAPVIKVKEVEAYLEKAKVALKALKEASGKKLAKLESELFKVEEAMELGKYERACGLIFALQLNIKRNVERLERRKALGIVEWAESEEEMSMEGWFSEVDLMQRLGLAEHLFRPLLNQLKEDHPEWVRVHGEQQDLYYSNEFVRVLEGVPEGWLSIPDLAKKYSMSQKRVKELLEECEKEAPDSPRKFGNRQQSYYSPDYDHFFANKYAERLKRYAPEKPEGWVSEKGVASQLGIDFEELMPVIDSAIGEYPDFSKIVKGKWYFSPEFIQKIENRAPVNWFSYEKVLEELGMEDRAYAEELIMRVADKKRFSKAFTVSDKEGVLYFSPRIVKRIEFEKEFDELRSKGWRTYKEVEKEHSLYRGDIVNKVYQLKLRDSRPKHFRRFYDRRVLDEYSIDFISPGMVNRILTAIRKDRRRKKK